MSGVSENAKQNPGAEAAEPRRETVSPSSASDSLAADSAPEPERGSASAVSGQVGASAKSAAPVASKRPDETEHRAQRNRAFKDVFWYGLARLLLFLVLLVVLILVIYLVQVQVPVAILAVLALIVAMPASAFLFPKLRRRANEGVAAWDSNRRAHKDYVREQLAERELE